MEMDNHTVRDASLQVAGDSMHVNGEADGRIVEGAKKRRGRRRTGG